jgi:hypothetical protein
LSKKLIRPADPGPAEARDPANGSLFIDRIYAQTISTSNITADDFTVIQVTSHNIWRVKKEKKKLSDLELYLKKKGGDCPIVVVY